MDRRSPALIERIVARLREHPGPRSSADLAREFLHVGLLDEAVADRLLEPVLAADSRLRRVATGWTVVEGRSGTSASPGAPAIDAPFVAVCSPAGISVTAVHAPPGVAGGDRPRYAVALGGASEVRRAAAQTGNSLPERAISLLEIARRLHGYRGPADPLRVAEALSLPHIEEEASAAAHARLIAALWERWRTELMLEAVDTLDTLEAMLEARLEPADFAGKSFGPDEVFALPEGPGVYAFEDDGGRAIYVGQSSSLRARVASYFSGPPRDDKDRAIRREARHLRARSVDTPPDAMILESRWIRRLDPLLNRRRQAGLSTAGTLPDGVLVVPAGPAERAPIAVLFAIAGGALRERVPLRSGSVRSARAALRAAEAVYLRWPEAPATQRAEAALLATWHRIRPDLLFLTPERCGDAAEMVRQLRGQPT